MFHAVSLASDVELAKVLAFSAPAAAGAAWPGWNTPSWELRRLVEPLRNGHGEVALATTRSSSIGSGWKRWETQQIRVLTVKRLERVADTARRELRVVTKH